MDEFLKTLARYLKHMGAEEKRDIENDYREHFEAGREAGKTQEEVAAALGDPAALARMHNMRHAAGAAHASRSLPDMLRLVGAALSYKAGGGIVVTCLYAVCLSALLALFALAAALLLAGLGSVVLTAAELGAAYYAYAVLALFTALALTAVGLLMMRGVARLWRLCLSRMPLLSRRIMNKGAAI